MVYKNVHMCSLSTDTSNQRGEKEFSESEKNWEGVGPEQAPFSKVSSPSPASVQSHKHPEFAILPEMSSKLVNEC